MNKELKNTVDKINQLDLVKEIKALALTAIYIREDENDDAIETLERLAGDENCSATVHCILGDLYLSKGFDLFASAKKQYNKVFELMEGHQDGIEYLAAKAGLTEIKAVENEEGVQQLRQEIEDKLNALGLSEQRSLLEVALTSEISQNVELASLVAFSNTENCPIGIRNCNPPQVNRYKPHEMASCIRCPNNP